MDLNFVDYCLYSVCIRILFNDWCDYFNKYIFVVYYFKNYLFFVFYFLIGVLIFFKYNN